MSGDAHRASVLCAAGEAKEMRRAAEAAGVGLACWLSALAAADAAEDLVATALPSVSRGERVRVTCTFDGQSWALVRGMASGRGMSVSSYLRALARVGGVNADAGMAIVQGRKTAARLARDRTRVYVKVSAEQLKGLVLGTARLSVADLDVNGYSRDALLKDASSTRLGKPDGG